MLHRLAGVSKRVREAFLAYEFHLVYHTLVQFCSVDLSSFYLDVLKDRLYCNPKDSEEGRSARTALYEIYAALLPLLAPILSFTAEEAWAALPAEGGPSVFLTAWRDTEAFRLGESADGAYETLSAFRREVFLEIEQLRGGGKVGSSLECALDITQSAALDQALAALPVDLAELFIVSHVRKDFADTVDGTWHASEALARTYFRVRVSEEGKCPRCWKRSVPPGSELCVRCAGVVK